MKFRVEKLLILCCLAGMTAYPARAAGFPDEGDYFIHISSVNRVINNNWLGIPKSVDCTVAWELYQSAADDWQQIDVNQLDAYRVFIREEAGEEFKVSSVEVTGNYYTFEGKSAGKSYNFFVRGYRNGVEAALSDTAHVLTGRVLAAEEESEPLVWHHYFPLSGRIPLWIIQRPQFFDGATLAGKFAFHVIWWAFLIGVIFPLRACVFRLRLGSVFPMKKGVRLAGYDKIYAQNLDTEFQKEILDKWQIIIERANTHMRKFMSQKKNFDMNEVKEEHTSYWRETGTQEISNLRDRIKEFRWDNYPTGRILKAGLDSHEMGGFQYFEVSKEVERSIENRASSELERLRRRSHVDWFYNLGTLTPLVGLFGTATGISHAFAQLTFMRTNVTQAQLVKRLAGGIYEALWTTIEGLVVGVAFTLFYYWYNNKLNWIYSKWEEIYVKISENL
jgi:biopolymer transport protein ExbB/TolQ